MPRKGFTLSEVLLVLAVIGVVAALTIPTLTQKMGTEQQTAKFKKEYSALSQVYTQIISEGNGSVLGRSFVGTSNANAFNAFADRLNVIKRCGTSNGCWYSIPIKFLNGSGNLYADAESSLATSGNGILSDGAIISISDYSNDCTTNAGVGPLQLATCGYILIDTNGFSGPNTYGRDVFGLYITQTGLFPEGSYGTSFSCTTATTDTGAGCAQRILSEGKMNY